MSKPMRLVGRRVSITLLVEDDGIIGRRHGQDERRRSNINKLDNE